MRTAFLLIVLSGALAATPTLRLSNTVVGPGPVPVGAASSTATLEAYNIGDGTLSLSVWIPPEATWVSATVGAGTCTQSVFPGPCIPILFTLTTASLSAGTYSASVSVLDPRAKDSPQVVIVTVMVGSTTTNRLETWMAPGTRYDAWNWTAVLCGRTCPSATAATTDGGTWLSVVANLMGSLGGRVADIEIWVAPPVSMNDGTYSGVINGTYSPVAVVPVTMHVASPPYAVPSTSQISLQLAQGGPAMAYPFLPAIALGNEGSTLVAQSVSATGAGVSASISGGQVLVAVDPGALAPGTYPNAGSLTIQCNAINCPLQIPISLTVVARGAPLINYQGVVDNATFTPGGIVAQGDVTVVQGEQLSFSAPVYASGGQLPTTLGGATVLVNGAPAPLFYSSYGQIAFQMPSNVPVGNALVQVARDGQTSNTAEVPVAQRVPGIVVITDAAYNVLDLVHPAKSGSTVLIWAIGLGPTIPAVLDGTPAPGNPLAMATPAPVVQLGAYSVTPLFALLSPGSVGLYQIAVTLPGGATGVNSVRLIVPGNSSNTAAIAIQ